jgi:hypothetical protein
MAFGERLCHTCGTVVKVDLRCAYTLLGARGLRPLTWLAVRENHVPQNSTQAAETVTVPGDSPTARSGFAQRIHDDNVLRCRAAFRQELRGDRVAGQNETRGQVAGHHPWGNMRWRL